MWKYLLVAILAVGLWYAYTSYPQEHKTDGKNVSNGVIRYGRETIASLEGNGFVTLEGTTVRNMLLVNGNLDAKNAKVGSLSVNGHASLLDTTIDAKSEINGFLSATNTTFRSELTVSTQSATFSGCTLSGGIVVKKPAWSFGRQTLELTEKTICKGPITFEGGNGKVILSKTSQILGAINGAEVEKQ